MFLSGKAMNALRFFKEPKNVQIALMHQLEKVANQLK